jgi:hypothetical protein
MCEAGKGVDRGVVPMDRIATREPGVTDWAATPGRVRPAITKLVSAILLDGGRALLAAVAIPFPRPDRIFIPI